MVDVQSASEPVILFIASYRTLDLTPHEGQLEQVIDPNREVAQLIIRAHTDTVGSPAENRVRSKRYADAVADWFVSRGLDATLIDARGLGDAELAVATGDEVDEALNRRIEITVRYRN